MPPSSHSWFGPSKGALGVNCPPSIKLTEDIEEKSGIQAIEGTCAHELAEYKGRLALGIPGMKRPVSDFDSDEMEEATDIYASILQDVVGQTKLKCSDPLVLFETQVTMGDYVPGSFGTCDFMCVADSELTVVDFKYGFQEISADGNVQMSMYAFGAYLLFGLLYDFDSVTMIIVQPRIRNISRWTITLTELLDWAENVLKPAAALAAKGEGDFNPGPWCSKYYCKARSRCRARSEQLLKLVQMEFKPADLLSDDELACVMEKAEEVSKWAAEIMEYALQEAKENGKIFPGWKLVEGRSTAKLSDEESAAKAAKDAGYTDEQLYKKSFITLTALKKLMGKEDYETLILPYTSKSTPKISLVRESDKRPAVKQSAANDFND